MRRILVLLTRVVMAVYLVMSGVELLDRTEFGARHAAVADTAETLREVRGGDDPFGLMDQARDAGEAVRRLADGFDEAGQALN